MLYEPNQYMGWNTLVIFWGASTEKKICPQNPTSVKLIPWCDMKLLASLTPWLSECTTSPTCPWHLHFKRHIPRADREPMHSESALQRWDTGSLKGFQTQQIKARAHEKRNAVTSLFRVLPLTFRKKAWNVILVTLWCILEEKTLLCCLRERNIIIETNPFESETCSYCYIIINI